LLILLFQAESGKTMLMSGTEEDPGIIQQVTATVIQYLKKKKPTEVP